MTVRAPEVYDDAGGNAPLLFSSSDKVVLAFIKDFVLSRRSLSTADLSCFSLIS
jgi:accessory colonization factor AcfC